jgi:hypothetical protein
MVISESTELSRENNKEYYLSTMIDRGVFNGGILEWEKNKNYWVWELWRKLDKAYVEKRIVIFWHMPPRRDQGLGSPF